MSRLPHRGHLRRIEPLWLRVDRNRFKVAVFVVVFLITGVGLLTAVGSIPLLAIGIALDGVWPAVPSLILTLAAGLLALGVLWVARGLMNARTWVQIRFSAVPVPSDRMEPTRRLLSDVSIAAGLASTPELWLMPDDSVNAFAFGESRARGVMGVTQGFVDELTPAEQRAVFATLAARLRAGDTLWATAVAALMGPIYAIRHADTIGSLEWAGDAFFDSTVEVPDAPGGCLAALGVALVALVTWLALKLAAWTISVGHALTYRLGYEKADAEGMLLLKEPQPMLRALAKMVRARNAAGPGDRIYDGLFYCPTSGTPKVTIHERARMDRLREVLAVEGMADPLAQETPGGG